MKFVFRKSHSNAAAEDSTGAPRARRGRKVALYGVLVLAVAAVAGFGLRSIYGTTSASTGIARTVTVQRGIVQEMVTASGNISPATDASENFTTGGTVTAVNEELKNAPDKLNEKPHETWIIKVELANPAELNALLDATAYEAFIAEES